MIKPSNRILFDDKIGNRLREIARIDLEADENIEEIVFTISKGFGQYDVSFQFINFDGLPFLGGSL